MKKVEQDVSGDIWVDEELYVKLKPTNKNHSGKVKNELRERLMEIHQRLLLVSSVGIMLGNEDATDICEFMNTFLYD